MDCEKEGIGEVLGIKIYKVLGLTRGNTVDEARKKYRRELRRRHPDYGGRAEDFHLLQKAWKEAEEIGLESVFLGCVETTLSHKTLMTFREVVVSPEDV